MCEDHDPQEEASTAPEVMADPAFVARGRVLLDYDLATPNLRDHFAIAALQGILGNTDLVDMMCSSINEMTGEETVEKGMVIIAKNAYRYADQMMEARKR